MSFCCVNLGGKWQRLKYAPPSNKPPWGLIYGKYNCRITEPYSINSKSKKKPDFLDDNEEIVID